MLAREYAVDLRGYRGKVSASCLEEAGPKMKALLKGYRLLERWESLGSPIVCTGKPGPQWDVVEITAFGGSNVTDIEEIKWCPECAKFVEIEGALDTDGIYLRCMECGTELPG